MTDCGLLDSGDIIPNSWLVAIGFSTRESLSMPNEYYELMRVWLTEDAVHSKPQLQTSNIQTL